MAPRKGARVSKNGKAGSTEPADASTKMPRGRPRVEKAAPKKPTSQKSSGKKAPSEATAQKATPKKKSSKSANGTSRWDDWVPQDRLRKLTEDNLQLAKDLRKEMTNMQDEARGKGSKKAAPKNIKAGESNRATSSPAPQANPKKRARDFETEKEEVYESSLRFELNLPDLVRSILVDDWENVTKHLQLPNVPSKIPANQVLDEWFAYEEKQRAPDTASIDKLKEVIDGVKIYFKNSLGKTLLYRFERFQFTDIYYRTQDPKDELAAKSMGDIYGPEHLLRLLTHMPEYASHSAMDHQAILYLKEELQRFANWVIRYPNYDRYFSDPYRATTKEYQDRLKWSNGQ